jgi:DNA-binding NarL/FixJ family response regulator
VRPVPALGNFLYLLNYERNALVITILIVEDEALVAMDLQVVLKRYGYSVLGSASSAEEAVRLARSRRPDIVLMDIHLQGCGNGFSAAAEIEKEMPSVSIVFLSANGLPAVPKEFRSPKYVVLTKPFNIEQLRETLARVAARESSRHSGEADGQV